MKFWVENRNLQLTIIVTVCMLVAAIYVDRVAFSSDLNQEQAVLAARQGDYQKALSALDKLLDENPDNQGLIWDYIAISVWAGKNQQAWDWRDKVLLSDGPAYGVAALAKAGRNLGRFQESSDLLQSLVVKADTKLEHHISLAQSLAEGGDKVAAFEVLAQAKSLFGDSCALFMAQGYVREQYGEWVQAISAYRACLKIDVSHVEAFRQYVVALNAVGIPELAVERAKTRLEVFPKERLWRFYGDESALALRHAALPKFDGHTKIFDELRALRLLNRNFRLSVKNGDSWRPFNITTLMDLLVAFRDRKNYAEVLAIYEYLIDQEVKLPDFVIEAVADAYSFFKQPRRSRDLYQQVVEMRTSHPSNFAPRIALFYAYLETEDFSKAKDSINELISELPLQTKSASAPIIIGNDYRRDAELHRAYGAVFEDRLKYAQQEIERLSDGAPFNPDLRAARSAVYHWRGWPRRALQEALIGLSVHGDHVPLKRNLIQSMMDLNRHKEIEKPLQNLRKKYPTDKAILELENSLKKTKKTRVELGYRVAEAAAIPTGVRERISRLLVASPPLDYRYRLNVEGIRRRVRLADARPHHHRSSFFFTADTPFLSTRIGVAYDEYGERQNSYFAGLGVAFTDHWRIRVGYDELAPDISLRALNSGITATKTTLNAFYHVNDLMDFTLGYENHNYSDGNARRAYLLSGHRRLVNFPDYKAEGFLSYFASRNSRPGGPYFSPASDSSIDFTLSNDWLTYRKFNRKLNQVLALTYGVYDQFEFGSSILRSISYEHRLTDSQLYELVYGVRYGSREYDGLRERDRTLYFDSVWWF